MLSEIANYPQNLYLRLTERCPMKCCTCSHSVVNNKLYGELHSNPKDIRKLILNAKFVNICGDGEPLAYRDFFDYIPDYIPDDCELFFCTAGIHMDEEICEKIISTNISWISFSIDAGTEEVYRKIRGESWKKLWENVDTLIELKEDRCKPILKASMIITNTNICTLPDLITEIAKRKAFELLLIYKMDEYLGFDQSNFNDGSGVFYYQQERNIDNKKEFKYITKAIDLAHELNVNLIARGNFLGNNYEHNSM